MLKLSLFNILINQDEDLSTLFNSYTGSIIEVSNNTLGSNCFNECNNEEIQTLVKEGFLVHEELDEMARVLVSEKKAMIVDNDSQVSFVIAPTLQCNFKCEYCFEKTHPLVGLEIMSEQTKNKVFEKITQMCSNTTKKLHISWFGGEPLIAINIIYSLSKQLIEFCNSKGIVYEASLITNGYFFTTEVANGLKKYCRLNNVQISIDGSQQHYSEVKSTVKDAYKVVIENIRNCAKIVPIKIRLNFYNNNLHELQDALSDILDDELQSYIKVYFAEVTENQNQLIGNSKFYEAKKEFESFLQNSFPLLEYQKSSFSSKKTFCKLVRRNNLVIDSYGNFYRCERDIGWKEWIIGDAEIGLYYNEPDMKYMSCAHEQMCMSCSFFPLCLGGCPSETAHNSINRLDCSELKREVILSIKDKISIIKATS